MNILTSFFPIMMLALSCSHMIGHQACHNNDKACLKKEALRHAVKKKEFWQPYTNQPAQERIFTAPPEILDYILLQNRLQDFPDIPKTVPHDEQFLADFKAALKELPPEVVKLFEHKLLGIFLAKDIGGSGFTDMIRLQNGPLLGSFMIFDQQRLQKKANDWAQWKESTVFNSHRDWQLTMTIANNKENNRKNALSFIILHELAHVISSDSNIHPPWDESESETKSYPFMEMSWPADLNFAQSAKTSKFDQQEFPLRPLVVFYLKPKLEAHHMPEVYSELEKTNFPTLYGATNVGDDFAESFVTFVHARILKRPYRISIRHKGKEIKHFELCWEQPRCLQKRQFMEQLIFPKNK